MFTHLLEEDGALLEVGFSEYSKRHFLKRFEKDYKGKSWNATVSSILEDLRRIKFPGKDLQRRQKVDELWHKDNFWIFKYDFKIAGTKQSTKTSGNRCVVFLDAKNNRAEILLIYNKTDLPKNCGEQQWLEQTLRSKFSNLLINY